jgi:hypothetical protein
VSGWAVAAIVGGSIVLALPAGPALARSAHGTHAPTQDGATWTTVRRGSSGFAVLQVQYVLRSLGDSALIVDGQFGPRTEAAVKQFQSSHALQVDGIVGPRTAAALGLSGTAPAAAPSPAPATPAADTTATTPRFQHPKASVERWHAPAIAAGWTEADWQTLSCIINRESGGIATAKNSSSGAAGLLQIMYSIHASWLGVSAEQLLDGPTNLRLGRTLFVARGWSPWRSANNPC